MKIELRISNVNCNLRTIDFQQQKWYYATKDESFEILKIFGCFEDWKGRQLHGRRGLLLSNKGEIVLTSFIGNSDYRSIQEERHSEISFAFDIGEPHINVDVVVRELFDSGYESVSFGPNAYSTCAFGFSATTANPTRDESGWPKLWKIIEKHGLSYGCGGGHSHQTRRFVPTGKFQFGTHLRNEK